MQVSENLLNHFLDLAEYDDVKRQKAVIGVINGFTENEDYCMNRLISGLSSTRAAARLGFSCALTLILSSSSDRWKASKIFEMIDSNLDFENLGMNLPVAIGRHLAYTSMINSKSYTGAVKELVCRELALLEKQQTLNMAICDSIARLALQLNRGKFAQLVWPQLKNFASKPLVSITPEWMYFNMLCAPKFYSVMGNDVSYINADTGFSIENVDSEGFQAVLKQARGNDAVALGTKLLGFAQASKQFGTVYEGVIWPWLKHGDMNKALERMLRFNNVMLSTLDLKPCEVLSIFSPTFIKKLCLAKDREHFTLLPLAESVLEKLAQCMEKKDWTTENVLVLLGRLDAVRNGNFGSLFSSGADVIVRGVGRLDSEGVESYVSKVLKSGNVSVKRFGSMFSGWSSEIQEKVLKKLLQHESRNEEIHYTFCDCIASFFITKVRAGKGVKYIFEKSNQELLERVIHSVEEKLELPTMNSEVLFAMYIALRLWSLSAVDKQERDDYMRDAEELVTFDKESNSNDSAPQYSVLVDLMLSILSRSKRFHRSVIHYVFAALVSQFQFADIEHIFETINVPDDELLKMEEESDDGDAFDNEDEDTDLVESGDNAGSEVESSGSEKQSDTESDLDGEADPELVDDLKEALAGGAEDSGRKHNASTSSDFSDETMFRLDDALSAAFRKQKKHSTRNDAEKLLQSQEFRLKCFDLLLIVSSHEDANDFAMDMLIPLLETSREALRRKGGGPIFGKSRDLIQIIVRNKRSALSERKALKLFKKLIPASVKLVNPMLRNEVGKVSSFLFSSIGKVEDVGSSKLVQKLEANLDLYMTQDGSEILSDVVLAPLQTYPVNFARIFIEKLIAYAFDTSLRIFRRTEALSCAITFMRKDVVSSNEDERFWKKVTEKLGKKVADFISHLNTENLKPRFFAFVVRLLSTFVGVSSPENKKALLKLLGNGLTSLKDNTDLWGLNSKKKQQINNNFRKICGRNAVNSIKSVLEFLKKAEEND